MLIADSGWCVQSFIIYDKVWILTLMIFGGYLKYVRRRDVYIHVTLRIYTCESENIYISVWKYKYLTHGYELKRTE